MFADKHILMVDDSATIRVFLRNILAQNGGKVEEVGTGAEATALCDAGRKYDLILLDLLLPDTDGIQVLKHFREKDDETAIVMLTGMGGIKSAMNAVRQGADGYLEKQDLSIGGDYSEFFYALGQALNHRAGIVAQKQLHKLKTDFYSMVTHDLRSPTTTIALALDTLLNDEAGPLNDEQQELLTMGRSAINKMLNLINEYLDFAKIEAGYLRLNVGPTELRELLEASTRLVKLQAKARQQTFVLELPPGLIPIEADAERLTQVFDNLISNAIKYTPEGGRVTVGLSIADETATIRVSDTGPGVASEMLPALFTKYQRLPGATRRVQGTGLGLIIAKEIVEAHGGKIWAESEGVSGKGTTFTVTIPLRHDL